MRGSPNEGLKVLKAFCLGRFRGFDSTRGKTIRLQMGRYRIGGTP